MWRASHKLWRALHCPLALVGTTSTSPLFRWSNQLAGSCRHALGGCWLRPYSTGGALGNIRSDMVAVFTCNKCGTRAAKKFSRQAYDSGVVIATCPGCQVRHLLADRKGWFGPEGSVEDFLRERGEGVVRKQEDGTEEILLKDLLGWSQPKAPPG